MKNQDDNQTKSPVAMSHVCYDLTLHCYYEDVTMVVKTNPCRTSSIIFCLATSVRQSFDVNDQQGRQIHLQ